MQLPQEMMADERARNSALPPAFQAGLNNLTAAPRGPRGEEGESDDGERPLSWGQGVPLTCQHQRHLRPKDIINLYSVSRDFHKIVDGHMQSTVATWARFMAPASVGIFPISFYEGLFIKDPTGCPVDPAYYDMKRRSVPGQRERRADRVLMANATS